MTAAVIVLMFLVVSNVVAFGLMAYDKRCAGAGKWRVPEKTLFLAAACFGALGACSGWFSAIIKLGTGTSGYSFPRCWRSRSSC